MDYTGYRILSEPEDVAKFYEGKYETEDINENEYLIIKDKNGSLDFYCKHYGKIERVEYPTFYSQTEGEIKPRNPEQQCAMDLLLKPQSKVKLLRGVKGSGKDYLMWHCARHLIDKGKFQKIVFLRPHITVAGLPSIGALPGTADEKLEWCLAPLYDIAGGREIILDMVAREELEPVPMLWLRGRSFKNSIVYLTEGQNMTVELASLVLSRIGEGSELWLNGDNKQVDDKMFKTDNGIIRMVDRLTGNPLFGYTYLPKQERSEVARLSDLLDDEI